MDSRIKLVGLIYFIFALVVLARLFFWQVVKGENLAKLGKDQSEKDNYSLIKRGNILAEDGSFLVVSVNGWLVYAYLPEVEEDYHSLASRLALEFVDKVDKDVSEDDYRDTLEKEKNRLFGLLTRKDVKWVPLKSRISDEKKRKIESLGIKGIGFQMEEMRFYPEASSAAHLLGFVGKDDKGNNRGYFGLEGYYNLILGGKKAYEKKEGNFVFSFVSDRIKDNTSTGQIDIKTHIDKGLQILVEKKLAEGVKRYGAKGGSVVVMEPDTGAIKVSASFPSYYPFEYFRFGDEFFKDPVISYSFEPGSVFKVIVMASALDAKVVDVNTRCDICNGPLKVDKYFINTWDNKYHPHSTMTEVIVNSDNVGMSFVAKRLGKSRMYDYLKKFGFGELTGVDLEGEMSPPLREKDKWSDVDLVTASFGQGIAVTPIQLVRAISAIANGGLLVKPKVVKDILVGGITRPVNPELEKSRVISEEAASKITMMMAEAAKSGESKWTYLKGFKVAGKTGTAQIPIAGHYDPEKTMASFVGFAPYDKPSFVMLVTLVEPTTSPWASETAAPLWYTIAKDLFVFYKIRPEE